MAMNVQILTPKVLKDNLFGMQSALMIDLNQIIHQLIINVELQMVHLLYVENHLEIVILVNVNLIQIILFLIIMTGPILSLIKYFKKILCVNGKEGLEKITVIFVQMVEQLKKQHAVGHAHITKQLSILPITSGVIWTVCQATAAVIHAIIYHLAINFYICFIQ